MKCHHRVSDPPNGTRCLCEAVSKQYVTLSDCRECEHRDDSIRGLGDVVQRGAAALGIKKCRGCARRQRKLNEKFPL